MRFSFAVALHSSCTFLVALGLLAPGLARERGPRVEVSCPFPPVPVRIDKQRVLVYELHVTNFDVIPLTLKRLEVFANEENSPPLATLVDESLSAAMKGIGVSNGSKEKRTINPGGRVVVFVWIQLESNRRVPVSLKHRMLFSSGSADGGGATDSTLEDFQVPVSHHSVPVLSPPFNGGIWLAGDGPVNNSGHRRSIFAIDGQIYSPERFAIDWDKVGPNGDSHHDGKTRNENYWGYGEPILAVADGEITEVVDGIPDNTPGVLPPVTLDNIGGDHVILQIGPNLYVAYAHLQDGSIRVRLHDHVKRGDVLARLGNSGNTTGPHLHLQMTDRNSLLQAQGVPFVFESFTYLGPGSDYELDKHPSAPWEVSIPPGNSVIEFKQITK
jgi:murein DD-endopeptidase